MSLTAEQIEYGFWYYCPSSEFPPPAVTYPGDYQGSDRLHVFCSQLDLPSYQQRKIVNEWCKLLPGLKTVKYLWFSSKVSQDLFEAACQVPALEGLSIKWSSIKDLTPLTRAWELKYLHIGSSPQVENPLVLAQLDRLAVLEIENIKRLRSLDPIGELVQLEGLAVTGSISTTQIVESLVPLSRLLHLTYLSLLNLKAADRSLLPLCSLKSLVHLETGYWWPIEHFRALRECLPALRFGAPFRESWIQQFGLRSG